MRKTVLITGSLKGIGFEMAKQLASLGFHVIISGRDDNRLEASAENLRTEGASVDTLFMDVSSDQSVNEAAESLIFNNLKLDVLINNAAILLDDDNVLSEQSDRILQETLQTNTYGPLRVTKAFLKHMNKPARIINISSGGGSMTDPIGGWAPAYCVSKTALNALTRHLAYELDPSGISVNAACPGWVKTDMGGNDAPRPVEKGAETPVWLATEADQNLSGKIFRDKKETYW